MLSRCSDVCGEAVFLALMTVLASKQVVSAPHDLVSWVAEVSNVAGPRKLSHPCGKHMGAGTASRWDSFSGPNSLSNDTRSLGQGPLAALAVVGGRWLHRAALRSALG